MNTSPKGVSPRRAASPKSARKSPKARVAKSPARATASPQRRRPPAGKGNDLESPKPKSSPGSDKKSAKKGLQGDWTAIMLLLLLYTLQGIPMGLGASLPLLMVEKKVSSMEQAVFSMVAYPFAFKLLWAPLVDSVYSSSFGRRKTWIVPAQLAIGALLLTSSFRVNAMLGSDGGSVDVNKLTALFFSFYFLCATQDIAVDGLALTILSERNREYGATCNAIGQTLGYFLAYVGFLGLSAYGLATLGGFFFFWGWVFVASTVCVLLVKQDEHRAQEGSTGSQLLEAYKEMWLVLQLPAVRSLALVLLTVKAPLAAFDALAPLELMSKGVPKEHLAALSMIMLPISMATQAYVSQLFGSNPDGKLSMPPLLVFLTGFKARLFNGVLTVLLIFVLGIYSAAGDAIPLWLYIVAIGIIAVGGVASAAMFVAQMAFFNRVSDPKIGGTYMTMLNTISNLGGQWPGTFIFATKGAIERVTDAQTGFYGVCACSVVVGLVWFYLMQGRLLAIQALPAKRWISSS